MSCAAPIPSFLFALNVIRHDLQVNVSFIIRIISASLPNCQNLVLQVFDIIFKVQISVSICLISLVFRQYSEILRPEIDFKNPLNSP